MAKEEEDEKKPKKGKKGKKAPEPEKPKRSLKGTSRLFMGFRDRTPKIDRAPPAREERLLAACWSCCTPHFL